MYLKTKRKKSWLDLPNADLKDVLYSYDNALDSLNNIISEYHKIPKDNWQHILLRIDLLREITNITKNIEKYFDQEYFTGFLDKVIEIALRKQEYLKDLLFLKNNENILIKNLFDTSHITEYFTLTINNKRRYNYITQEMWGEFAIEAADPSHRRLLNEYYNSFVNQHDNKYYLLSNFFIWLENKSVSVFHPAIEILTTEQLENIKITVFNGRLCYNNNEFITTDAFLTYNLLEYGPRLYKEHIFVIDYKNNIYITYSAPNISHTSISNYYPIIGCGKIVMHEGKVIKIATDSGHYLPNIKHLGQILNIMLNKGVKFNDNVELIYFDKHTLKKVSFKNFVRLYKHYLKL